jgi:hypothetical protein
MRYQSVILGTLLMAEEPPSGDRAVFAFLELIALALMFEGISAFLNGKPWWILTACIGASLAVFIVGVKWPMVKSALPRAAAPVERIASSYRFRISAFLLVPFLIIVSGVFYMRTLRADLDAYAMPRTVTSAQSEKLRSYLSRYPRGSVTVKFAPSDAEATEFANQIFIALQRGGWDANTAVDNAAPYALNSGIDIYIKRTGGSASSNPQHPSPDEILVHAFQYADISNTITSGSGEAPTGAADGTVYVLVGHRPLSLVRISKYPWRTQLARWIAGW